MKKTAHIFCLILIIALLLPAACGTYGEEDQKSPPSRPDPDGNEKNKAKDARHESEDYSNSLKNLYNVYDYGAKGNGSTDDTEAIRKAIDHCHYNGGGTVLFPKGEFLSGTIHLKSNITLYLTEGATILGSREESDYTEQALVYAESEKNISIVGKGRIDGNGQFWWAMHFFGQWRPSRLIKLAGCSDIFISGITLTQSPKWTLHLLGCDNALIHGVKIRNTVGNNIASPNTDGIDLEACRFVEVAYCDIETGDDAIALKNGDDQYRRSSYNIDVHHCTLASWANAFKIGTETERDFHHISFRDSTIRASVDSNPGTRAIAGVAIISDDGANIHDITVSDIVMSKVKSPFFIRLQRRLRGDLSTPGSITDVTFSDIVVKNASFTSPIMGIDEAMIENVIFENVTVYSSQTGFENEKDKFVPDSEIAYPDANKYGRFPSSFIFGRHVAGCLRLKGDITFRKLKPDGRPEIAYDNVHKVESSMLPENVWTYDRTGSVISCKE